jgi:tRNA modification GTPase
MKEDTIVARATPLGRGAVALVRLSGPDAREVLRALAPDRGGALEPRRPTLLSIVDPDDGALLDRALVTLFPRPASFTGEDVIEISTHGGSLVPHLVEDACLRAGARPARAGEFTERAYLHGKLDLVQAEALADLIEGGSRAAHRTALHQMEGGLSRRLARIREGVVELEAVLVHHLDFPEEDDPPVTAAEVAAKGDALVQALDRLRRTAPEGMLLKDGALVVLAGPPNAGKSSLFNALLGEERAIVTEEPGTTRDAVEAPVTLGGFPFRLVDTAGLRSRAGRVERLGIEVARRYLDAARVILYCHAANEPWSDEERTFLREQERRTVRVLLTLWDRGGGETGVAGGIPVSVRTGEGLDRIRGELRDAAFAGLASGDGGGEVVTRGRQLRGIERAARELQAFSEALRGGVPAEMAATHLRPAETALEELLGVIEPEEVLDRLFREFCIGK